MLRGRHMTRTRKFPGPFFSTFIVNVENDPHRHVRPYQDIKRVNIVISHAYEPDNGLNGTKV